MKLPKKLLNTFLRNEDDWTNGTNYDVYLKDDLKYLDEEILWYDYEMEGDHLLSFLCYTQNKVAIKINNLFGEDVLLILWRNPPIKAKGE